MLPAGGRSENAGSQGKGGFFPAARHSLVAFGHTGGSASRTRGFTLIELLVVLVILSLAGGAVLLTMPSGNATLYRQADDFALHLKRAQEAAILDGHAMQISADATGYRFSRRHFGDWIALNEQPFTPRPWAGGIQAVLPRRNPRLGFRFDATGMAEPQTLQLANGNTRVRVSVDAAGKVSVQ